MKYFPAKRTPLQKKIETLSCKIARLKVSIMKSANASKARDSLRKKLRLCYDDVKALIAQYCTGKG